MGFNTKASQPSGSNGGGSNVTDLERKVWREYVFNQITNIEAESVAGKENTLRKEDDVVGVVSLMLELGEIPRKSFFDTKCSLPDGEEEYSDEEREYMEKYKTADFEWVTDKGKPVRKQTNLRNEPEWVICVDFPEVLIDYAKNPYYSGSKEEDIKPYRVCINGEWQGALNKNIAYYPWGDRNYFNKLSKAVGVFEEFKDSQYDLATLVNGVCYFKLRVDLTEKDEEVSYLNESILGEPTKIKATKVGKHSISVEEQIPDNVGDVEFVGILQNDKDGYSDDTLRQIRWLWKQTIQNGVDWEDTLLCKALKKFDAARMNQSDSGEEKEVKKETVKKEPKKVEVAKREPDVPMDFDD